MTALRCVGEIEYRMLPGTRRKTTDIVIERNGEVVVRPPEGYTSEQVDAVVHSKRMWIYRNLAEWKDLNATAVTREWVSGETFLYLGRSYRLSLVRDQNTSLKLKDGRFCLCRSAVEQGGSKAAREAFKAFYQAKGQRQLSSRASHFAPKVGVRHSAISVRDLGYRWASCGKAGRLNFHWKCMMAPPRIIDYIVVHELCHMHQGNHNEAFWNEVDKVMPDYMERKAWLRKNGASFNI